MTTSSTLRPIRGIWTSQPTREGAGVRLRRAFGFQDPARFDPFLLLDDFRSDVPDDYIAGFPWHPHRGIETITYVLDGDVEHEDSLGNGGVIGAGDVQWMTAGNGILHQEMPQGDARGRMAGFQLWANLPAAHKMMDPRYRDVPHDTVPLVHTSDGATIRLIAGTVDGPDGPVHGPVQDIVTDPTYLDVALPAHTRFARAVPRGHTVFAYVIDGDAHFHPSADDAPTDTEPHGNGTLVLFGDGDAIQITTAQRPVRVLLASGKPIGEPIAWYGPIVMNTDDELRLAFDELDRGDFIKHRPT